MLKNRSRPAIFRLLITLAAACLLTACLTEIPLEVPPGNNSSIAIRGALVSSDSSYVRIKITRVSDFQASDIPEGIPGAFVVLEDERGGSISVPHREEGEYYLDIWEHPGVLDLSPGNAFRLTVSTPDGKIYVSELETLNSVPAPTAITQVSEIRTELNHLGNEVDQEYLQFYVTTPLTAAQHEDRALLRWSFEGVYRLSESVGLTKICYISEPLNLENVVVFNGRSSLQDVLTGFFLMEMPYDFRFFEGYYLTVRQQSLSAGAFQYWNQVGKVVDRTGDIFEEPPGKIPGNFRNTTDETEEVFGYFHAVQETVIRYRVQKGVSPLRYICSQNPDSPYFLCVNCLQHPRSSLDKPDYWE